MNSGIYSITNKNNGKRYIGQSVDLHKRKVTHLWLLKNNRHFNTHLQRAWNNGEEFEFEILEECEPSSCNEREIFYIAKFDSMKTGYNLCVGGNSTTGRVCTEHTKAIISAKARGRKWSQESIEMRTQTLREHLKNDPEFARRYRENISSKLKGRESWNKGVPCPEWKKKQVSEKLKGRHISDEHKEKLRNLYSGEKSITSKLKKIDVVNIRIRFLNGEKQIDICKDYPVKPQTIYDIVWGRRWKSVPNNLKELEEMKWKIESLEADK